MKVTITAIKIAEDPPCAIFTCGKESRWQMKLAVAIFSDLFAEY